MQARLLADRDKIGDQSPLSLLVRKRDDGVHLTLDGQATYTIAPGCVVEVRETGSAATLLRPPESDNFHNLAEKLNWGV